MVGGGSHSLGPRLGGGEVHHQDCRGSRLLAGKLASSLHHLLRSAGLLSMGLRSLSLLMSVQLLKGEAGVLPRCHHPWWNHHHDLSVGTSSIHGVVVIGERGAPVPMLLGGERLEPPLSA
jgi:hypothetical protein